MMKVLSSIMKLFKKGQAIETAVATFSNFVILPTREELQKQVDKITWLEELKQEYIHQISNKKLLTSLEIEASRLRLEINMYQELIVNAMLKLEEEKTSNQSNFSKLSRMLKFKIYSCKLQQLENETILRLVALKEILEEKPFLMPYKKNSIKATMENLSLSKIVLSNNLVACEQEIERDLIEYGAISTTENDNQLQEKKLKMLEQIRNHLSVEEMKLQLEDSSKGIEIAKKELAIEIYVYQHKDDIEALKNRLERMSEIDITYADKEKILGILKDIEYQYLAFYEYGRKLITIEDLMQLYLIKFNILALSEIGICDTFVDENTTGIELECYKGIVEREIELFVTGFSEVNDPELVKIITNILKQGKQTLDIEEILTDKYLFNVFLSIGSRKDLIQFIKNFKVKKSDYSNIDFCDEVFDFEEELPLETIYRLMLAQNIGEDAKLYEFFANDLYLANQYPSGDNKPYYDLPVGLRGIHYTIDSEVERDVLQEQTFLMIQKMRELMSEKYVICPSTLMYIKGGLEFLKDTHIKKFIFLEGLELENYEIDNVEILERKENKIVCYDKEKNEIITSDSKCYISKKWGNFNAAGFMIHVLDKRLFIEEYHDYEYGKTVLQKGLNMIETRKNSKTKLLSRDYVDVSTKYGDFCLHIEEVTKSRWGPCISLSLYHGHHDIVIDKTTNDFNWSEYGIFRTKYMKENDFYQWMLGFVDSVWSHPFRNIWSYGETTLNGEISHSPIYSFSEYQGNGKKGTILIDGNLKLSENRACLPDMFENLEVDGYENGIYGSKAYFGTSSECVVILKFQHSHFISIIYKKRNKKTGVFETTEKRNMKSDMNEAFTEQDFEIIISNLEKMFIEISLKKFIIDEIKTYVDLHYRNNNIYIDGLCPPLDIINLSNVLKCRSYDEVQDILEYSDKVPISEFVEKLIENITQVFHITIGDLLGSLKQKEQEEAKKLLLKRKDSE